MTTQPTRETSISKIDFVMRLEQGTCAQPCGRRPADGKEALRRGMNKRFPAKIEHQLGVLQAHRRVEHLFPAPLTNDPQQPPVVRPLSLGAVHGG